MIQSINVAEIRNQKMSMLNTAKTQNAQLSSNAVSSPISKEAGNALKIRQFNLAKSLAFQGNFHQELEDSFKRLTTCDFVDKDGNPVRGEDVGEKAHINTLVSKFTPNLSQIGDHIGSDHISVNKDVMTRADLKVDTTKTIKNSKDIVFQLLTQNREKGIKGEYFNPNRSKPLRQELAIRLTQGNDGTRITQEDVYLLDTKGNFMSVIEDGDDVLMLDMGHITKKDKSHGILDITARKFDSITGKENVFSPFKKEDIKIITRPEAQAARAAKVEKLVNEKGWIKGGQGGEIVIGMQDGRFVEELKESLVTFKEKIAKGEVELPEFYANPNAKDFRLAMLAGGFGSRAEFTNASSDAIFHDIDGGAQSTKGVFRTATGLTPMETTLVSLHLAGMLDLSKINFEGPEANIKFYLNKSQTNKGNGGFTVDLVKTLDEKFGHKKYTMMFANDAMSRTTDAIISTVDKVASGDAAVVMIAKEVKSKDCLNTFGIMKTDENNQVLDFAEKPKSIPEGYEKNGNCLTNAFQFVVTDEVLEILSDVEPFFSTTDKSKETRDWSKQYIPIIKTLCEETDKDLIRAKLSSVFGPNAKPLSDEIIDKAQAKLAGKKIYATPTNEPWADCGQLNALSYTTSQIASGDFRLEPFEQENVLKCVNIDTGLIASSPEQKQIIEEKYDIKGQVMVVPKARVVSSERIANIPVLEHNDPPKEDK